MKFERRTAGYTEQDHKRNERILNKLIKPITDYIQNYQRKWKKHVNKMNAGWIRKQILRYQPEGERSLGRPVKSCEKIWDRNGTPRLILYKKKKKKKKNCTSLFHERHLLQLRCLLAFNKILRNVFGSHTFDARLMDMIVAK